MVEEPLLTLDNLVDRALRDDAELQRDLDESSYEGRDIYDELLPEFDTIREVVVNELHERTGTARELQERLTAIEKEAGERPSPGEYTASLGGLIAIGIFYCLVVVAGAVVTFERGGWPIQELLSVHTWIPLFSWLAPAIVWLASVGLLQSRRNRNGVRQQSEYKQRLVAWTAKHDDVTARHDVKVLQDQLVALEQKIDTLLIERTKQAIVAAINRRKAPSYATTLQIRRPRGFGEVFDKRFTIATPARRRLEFMLKSMPGGSIGIAGSRGAGKTTLLKMFCGPKRIIETLNDKKVLGVLVSAPVAYEARDFILYLFSTVCQNVIDAEGGKYTVPELPEDEPAPDLRDSAAGQLLRPLPRFLFNAGVGLTTIGVLLALLLAANSTGSVATNANAVGPAAARPAQVADGQKSGSTAPVPASGQNAGGPPSTSFGSRLLDQLKIQPAAWIGSGLSLVATSLMLAEIVGLGAWWLFVSRSARLLLPLYAWSDKAREAIHDYLRGQHELAASRRGRPPESEVLIRSQAPNDGLRARAEQWLRTIKFQQTFTTGWSGALKLPIGLEGGVNRAVTLAQNQMSLPELVAILSRFLEETSLKYQVIIGIDELDKIASDTLAQRFLNDIKSIFGLERCFYLISVSEDAMSQFERRGLPFRDVFDSSFDDFVYVDHLTFESAQELLQQRVVGRPIPYFALSYCMSAGLARDLIRTFRGVLEVHGQATQSGLASVCDQLVVADLRAKIRAIVAAARKLAQDERADGFVETLFELESHVRDDSALSEFATRLTPISAPSARSPLQSATARQADGTETNKIDRLAISQQLDALKDEIATYLLYAVTLRRFFNDGITKDMLTLGGAGHVDVLAKARQVLGVNPSITRALLRAFLEAHNLTPVPPALVRREAAQVG